MEELPNKKEKFKAAFTSFLVEYDKGIRLLQDDAKAVSLFTISKVKDMRDRRKHRQTSPGIVDILDEVNPGAGSEILSHFKFNWLTIHHDITDTSESLDTLYMDLQKVFQSVNNSHKIITIAHEELTGLPKIIKSLEDTNKKVESIGDIMRKVEEDMMEYLKVSNRLDHERKKHSLALQYQKFADEKDSEIKEWEGVVSHEKQLAMELQEELEKAALKERQDALESMFRIQMAEYQEKGEVERPLVSEEQAKERTLSEISVEGIEIKDDDGNEALNDFLGDVPNDGNPNDLTSRGDEQTTLEEEEDN